MNKYPVYVISKGRADLKNHTAKFLFDDGVDAKIVIEPQELDQYSKRFGLEKILTLPFSNLGQGSIPARNWVWEHSKSLNSKRHWILDDNINGVITWKNGKRVKCNSLEGFIHIENVVDRLRHHSRELINPILNKRVINA